MFTIIESHNGNKKSIGYFETLQEAKEIIEQKRKEFLKQGYYSHIVKSKKYFKSGEVYYYVAVRKYNSIRDDFWSWTIVKLTKNQKINFNLCNNEIFNELFDEKRSEQINLRLSRTEQKVLYELAKRIGCKPAHILRASLFNTFEKEIKMIMKRT